MKNQSILLAFACVGLAAPVYGQQGAPPPVTDLGEHEIGSKLVRDDGPLPNGGQVVMSYANVADKILPSVVTIFSSSPVKAPSVDRIPPQLREHLYRFFGVPDGFDGMDEDEAPRRRRGLPEPEGESEEDDPRNQQRGVGSGIIITADGYIVTNNHVITDSKKIEVAVDVAGETKTFTANIIGADPLTDVALIKIDATGLKPATITDSSKLRVGDVVLAAGAPMELSRSITQGIVSALGRSNEGIVRKGRMQGYEDFIQTDASINPGNSGGPLVDGMGRVVGISTAILSRSGMNAGIGFAIPINMAIHIVEDLIDDGSVQRGFLGVLPATTDSPLAKRLGIKEQPGALIEEVTAETPAARAGIEVGDVVTRINGQRVDDPSRLRLIVSSIKPGTPITVDLLRNNELMTVTAKLEALPEEALAELGPRGAPRGQPQQATTELVTGVTVQNLSPALRERFDVPQEIDGIIVTRVDPDSRAAAMGVEEGDVITHINRQQATSAAEARTMANSGDPTVLLRVYRKGDTMLLMIGNN
jgi:serine protease Do